MKQSLSLSPILGIAGNHNNFDSGTVRIARAGWLLSLADLFTLLLSVMIVTAELSGSQTHVTEASTHIKSDGITVGTPFAQSLELAKVKKVVFLAEDFYLQSGELSLSGYKTLKLLDSFRINSPEIIKLQSCGGSRDEQGWHRSLTQVLTVSGHIFDSSGPEERLISMTSEGCFVDEIEVEGVVVELFWNS